MLVWTVQIKYRGLSERLVNLRIIPRYLENRAALWSSEYLQLVAGFYIRIFVYQT